MEKYRIHQTRDFRPWLESQAKANRKVSARHVLSYIVELEQRVSQVENGMSFELLEQLAQLDANAKVQVASFDELTNSELFHVLVGLTAAIELAESLDETPRFTYRLRQVIAELRNRLDPAPQISFQSPRDPEIITRKVY